MIRVYRISNSFNRKSYIGITESSLSVRFKQHCSPRDSVRVRYIHRAIKKHGKELFKIEELCLCLTRKSAGIVEQQLIKKYRTQAPNGYNLTAGGDVGSTHSLATKKKISRSKKGTVISLESKRKMSRAQRGRKHSLITRAKMSKARMGWKPSKLTLKKMSIAARNRPSMSKATRRKMSKSHTGTSWTPLMREKITAAQQTPNYRDKMRAASARRIASLAF